MPSSSWSDDELKVWVRVTIRMAAKKPNIPDRHALIGERWEAAKPFIAKETLEGMIQTMSEIRQSASTWPENQI